MGQSRSKHAETRHATSKIIAAIDFGTTYTGFAYAFSDNMDTFYTGSHGSSLKGDRVPTVLLLEPDGDFSSFGIKAEEEYAGLMNDKDKPGLHHEYRLFREFKMTLYAQKDKLHKTVTINDTEGRPKNAIEVFSIVIEYLKRLILESIEESVVGLSSNFESRIEWMLTIPAIWSDSARQFMRSAATKGGIPETKLRLVLEPEAAALFCKSQLLMATQTTGLTTLPQGTKYILADLGGGTADICVHEILKNENLRELHRADGGPFGGLSVNSEFIQFIIKLFGAKAWREFQNEKCYDYIQMMQAFERKKRDFDSENKLQLIVGVPAFFTDKCKHDTLSTLANDIKQSKYADTVTFKDYKLTCKHTIMEDFFKPSVEGIVTKLREVITECKNDSIKLLLLVGGYAESKYVREFIKKEMNQMKVFIVKDPSLAVLKGAVLMGFKPKDIIARRARYTYGFAVAREFEKETHQESLKFMREGKILCCNIFSKVIEKDQIVTFHDKFIVETSDSLKQPDSKKMELTVALFKTEERNPQYCLETDNCYEVGKIIVTPPANGWPDHVILALILIVGETEFTVQAIDKSSGREYETSVDFL